MRTFGWNTAYLGHFGRQCGIEIMSKKCQKTIWVNLKSHISKSFRRKVLHNTYVQKIPRFEWISLIRKSHFLHSLGKKSDVWYRSNKPLNWDINKPQTDLDETSHYQGIWGQITGIQLYYLYDIGCKKWCFLSLREKIWWRICASQKQWFEWVWMRKCISRQFC